MTSKTTELSLDEIFNLAKASLLKHGANEENADAVANTVTNAERDGSLSHGLFRIPGYIKALQSKKVDGSAKPEIKRLHQQYLDVMQRMDLLHLHINIVLSLLLKLLINLELLE